MSFQGDLRRAGIDPQLVVRTKKILIPAASVLTLRATPYTLVPAQGSGRIIELVSGLLFLDSGSVAYTESTDNLVVRYTDGSGVVVSQVIEMTGFITLTADSYTNILPAVDSIVAATGAKNKPLVLHNNGNGEFGNDGNGTLTVHLAYRVWDFS